MGWPVLTCDGWDMEDEFGTGAFGGRGKGWAGMSDEGPDCA